MSAEIAVYVVDVGSPQGGLAWARVRPEANAVPEGHHDLELMCTALLADLTVGTRVALGFEGPLSLPIRNDYRQLYRAREGERGRAWSAGAGPGACVGAMVIAAWVLRRIRAAEPALALTLDADAWADGSGSLLLWEAFVSGKGHARDANGEGVSAHIQDAATAAVAFRRWLASSPRPASAVHAEAAISTIGAAALYAGWTLPLSVLHDRCLVLWPDEAHGRDVSMLVCKAGD